MDRKRQTGQSGEAGRQHRAPRLIPAGVSHHRAVRKSALQALCAAGTLPARVILDPRGRRLIRTTTPVTFQHYEDQLGEAVGKGLLAVLFTCGLSLLLAALISALT